MTMINFTEQFPAYACIGDSIEVIIDGTTYIATIAYDLEAHIDDTDTYSENRDLYVTDREYVDAMKIRTAYFDDDWCYCGIILSAVTDNGWSKNNIASLWGIELNHPLVEDNAYIKEVADELLSEYFDNYRGNKS